MLDIITTYFSLASCYQKLTLQLHHTINYCFSLLFTPKMFFIFYCSHCALPTDPLLPLHTIPPPSFISQCSRYLLLANIANILLSLLHFPSMHLSLLPLTSSLCITRNYDHSCASISHFHFTYLYALSLNIIPIFIIDRLSNSAPFTPI